MFVRVWDLISHFLLFDVGLVILPPHSLGFFTCRNPLPLVVTRRPVPTRRWLRRTVQVGAWDFDSTSP